MSHDTSAKSTAATQASVAGPTPLERYSATASSSARVVIKNYSTSFSLACRMLDKQSQMHIANIYALVRLVDEVVDGVAREAGLSDQATAQALDSLEAETEAAMKSGYSTNMIVHAFACTAGHSSIGTELTRPFFNSMRDDLRISTHDEVSLDRYIFGSAEVVGVMCLRIFRSAPNAPTGHDAEVESAARRLGVAFQKVNFLRDLAVDTNELGRCYFPGLDPSKFSDEHKNRLVQEISADLDAAARGIAFLPPRAALAVSLAHGLFTELNAQLGRTSASDLRLRRVSVSLGRKAAIALQALVSYSFKRPRR